MRRELSTKFNWMYRWAIPGLLTVAAIAVIWQAGGAGLSGEPDLGDTLIAITSAVLMMVVARWFDRGKRVWLDDNLLVVSDHRREARIELTDIKSVVATRWVKPDRVTIQFRRATVFGNRILFFPPARWFDFSQPHPVSQELSRLVEEAGNATG